LHDVSVSAELIGNGEAAAGRSGRDSSSMVISRIDLAMRRIAGADF
jgi:hypothetical protein